ncbi:hypothetical protein M9H77_08239 [Catharanthus roseus]|uniref:Uncharacterized protein n=1 Tax=Catharanthus roseus TaxID=4058 RepID=A0ACC0BXF1_CATRO|nr:hypothetical protein M9H77_08239 [Catharanthus roseus]
MKCQVVIIGILGEIEVKYITRVKFEKVPHEYSAIKGIQDSVHEILMNLKEIVLRSNLYRTCDSSICVRDPGYVTAQDIVLPSYVEIVDNTEHIASLMEPIDLCIELQIERNHGYLIKMPQNFQDRSYPIDVVFMPVQNANHSIHSYGNENEKQEILFLEIWTNGKENSHLENNQYPIPLSPFTFHEKLAKLIKKKKEIAFKSIFIDQSELPPGIFNCLKRSNIQTLLDLWNNSQEDLIKKKHFA